MKQKIDITKQEFNDLISKNGQDEVVKMVTNNEPNKQIKVYENHIVVSDLKKTKILTNKKRKKLNRTLKRKKQRLVKREGIRDFASNLNKELPRSELWFQSLYKNHYALREDQYNRPFHHKYIPDVINFEFKYVIEIDGSIHNNPEVIKKDMKKTEYYLKNGFKVFRVKAFNNDSYIQLIKDLFIHRRRFSYPTKQFREYLLTLGYDYSTIF